MPPVNHENVIKIQKLNIQSFTFIIDTSSVGSLKLQHIVNKMNFIPILYFAILRSGFGNPLEKEDDEDFVDSTGTTEFPTEYFSDMPETIIINYIDAATLIKFDNKGEKMMGVSDDKCDNGRVNLFTDFDPNNIEEIKLHTTCFENETWVPNNLTQPVLTIMNLPERYIPIHKCMHITINYLEPIPTIGPHR